MASLTVGELYGELRLDSTHFNRGLTQAHGDFASFGKGLLGKAAVLGAGLGAAIGAKELIGKVADIGIGFQDLSNTFRAVTGATSAQMAEMGRRAIDLGNDLSLPSTSAADAERAMVELAKGGLSVADAMDAAKGTLQLAAAAEVDAGQAAIYQADALNTFHLRGKDAVMVADLLAAAANASSGEITDMGLSLQQAGSVFASAHVPIQDVVTLISEMAQNGIRGSDAGTSLKTMMIALQSPTSQQAELMRRLNFNLYDSQGRMRNFRDIIKDVQGPLSKLTQQQRDAALATIFGSDAVRAANIIFGQGTDAFDQMRAAVTREGAAAEVAGAKAQGLGGALRGLQSQLETLALTVYQQGEPALEALARGASEKLPDALDGVKVKVGDLRKVWDPFVKESAAMWLDAFRDSATTTDSLKRNITDLQKTFDDFVKSEGFASIIAALAVYLPAAVALDYRALALLMDQIRLTATVFAGMAHVMWDVSQGDFKAAWADLERSSHDFNEGIKNSTTDLQEWMKAAAHLTSDDLQREYARMRWQINDQMNGSAADQRLAWESMRNDARQIVKETGHEVPSELMQGIHEGKSAVTAEAREAVKEAVDGARAEASASRDVGGLLAAGIALGIVSNSGEIDTAARQAIRRALLEARKEADIHSPSRVWADQLGRPLAQGIGVGIHSELASLTAGLTAGLGRDLARSMHAVRVPASLTAGEVARIVISMTGAASGPAASRTVNVNQTFNGQTADHRQMLADAAWDARRLR